MVLLFVMGLTVLCLLGLGGVATLGDGSDAWKNVQSSCDFGFKAGLGAILGLLGGKAS
jgi:hypothetical protein